MAGTLGILVDKGRPYDLVIKLMDSLREEVQRNEGKDGSPKGTDAPDEVVMEIGTIPLNDLGGVQLEDSAPEIMRAKGWDRMVYVTDLPAAAHRPIVSQSAHSARAFLLSLPAFGMLRAKRGLKEELLHICRGQTPGAGEEEHVVDHVTGGDPQAASTRVLNGRGRTVRLLLGMVACNRPLHFVKVLSGCLALGVATGGFGIFYGSVWQMSHMVSYFRLGIISFMAVFALTTWLILHNNLWNKWQDSDYDAGDRWKNRIDNLATAITVAIASLAIYFLIFILMLIVSWTVVPVEYFSQQISDSVNFKDYVDLAWFAASLGCMGGALGAGFDSEEAIRNATYRRRRVRRQKIEDAYSTKQ